MEEEEKKFQKLSALSQKYPNEENLPDFIYNINIADSSDDSSNEYEETCINAPIKKPSEINIPSTTKKPTLIQPPPAYLKKKDIIINSQQNLNDVKKINIPLDTIIANKKYKEEDKINIEKKREDNSNIKHDEETCINAPIKKPSEINIPSTTQKSTLIQPSSADLKNKVIIINSQQNLNNVIKINIPFDTILDNKKYNKEDKINIEKKREDNSNIKHKIKKSILINNEKENENETKYTSEITNNQINNNINDGENSNSFAIKIHDNKYNDNIIKKLNAFLFRFLINYVNNLIIDYHQSEEKIESDSLKKKKNIKYKKLRQISAKQANNTRVDFTKELLNKTVKEILSFDISKPNNIYQKDYNSKILEQYYNKSDKIREFVDTKYEMIINYLNEEINIFEGFIDTYNEELKKMNKNIKKNNKESLNHPHKNTLFIIKKNGKNKSKDPEFIVEKLKKLIDLIKKRKKK